MFLSIDTPSIDIGGLLFSGSDCRVEADGASVPECQAVDTDQMVMTCVNFYKEGEDGLPVSEERSIRENLKLSFFDEVGNAAVLYYIKK